MTALIDMGAQVSSMSSQFCEGLVLQIQPLGQLLELEGTGGAAIPYLGFVEVNLQIPGVTNYNEDMLLLVIVTTTYSEMVLVVVGFKIIDRPLSLMTKGELTKATMTWREALQSCHVWVASTNLHKLRQSQNGRGSRPLPSKGWPCRGVKFCLNDVKGLVHTMQKVTIPHFSTVSVHTNSSVKGHCMWVHVFMELVPGTQLPAAVVLTVTYGELHPRSSRVPISLHNLSACTMEILTKAVIGQVAPANQVPPVVNATRTSKELHPKPQKGWVLEALDIQGLKEWPKSEQEQARMMLLRWEHLFAHSDLDLGKPALIKHKIELTDQMPFKEHHWSIPPPHVQWRKGPYPGDAGYWCYLEVTQSIGWHSSPGPEKGWQSEVLYWPQEAEWLDHEGCILTTHIDKHLIAYKALKGSLHLTWNQDTGRLRWMRKVNHWLHSQWGHWACTSAKGCLSDLPMPPLLSRGLMENCLADLNLQWSIIYLDDIVIFLKDLASHLERLEAVLQKLEEAGLKLKPSKCELFWQQIAYLGHVISAQGIVTDEGKIEAIKKWPAPTNIKEVWSFLGFMGYYSLFIP